MELHAAQMHNLHAVQRAMVEAQAREVNCEWQYLDTKGCLQGPFPNAQMRLWYKHEMLPPDLPLRRTTDTRFASMSELFPPPREPFQSPPVSVEKAGARVAAPAKAGETDNTGKDLLRMVQGKQPTWQGQQAQGQINAALQKLFDGNGAAAEQPEVQKQQPAPQAQQPAAAGNSKKAQAKQASRKAKGDQTAQNAAWWADGWSAANASWWEWSTAWGPGGWEGEETWEHPPAEAGAKGRGKGKHGAGAEWKGADDAPTGTAKASSEKHSGTAHIASLGWGPKSEVQDLFPEDVIKKVTDEGIVWDVQWVSPLAVRFSQGKVHPFFHERGPITEVLLQIQVSEDEPNGKIGQHRYKRINPPFPPIRLLHLKQQGVLVTLDNRRLYALQRIALQEWPAVCLIKAFCVDELTPARLKAENRKFTNRLGGLQVEVESRSSAFDTFSWVTEAAKVEVARFCRPISFKAMDKAISLLPMLVVHTLMSPTMRPFLQSRWPLLKFCSTLFRNPEHQSFPTRRLLLLHVLELARPHRQVCVCPSLCVEYKTETVVTLSKGKSLVSSRVSIAKPVALQKANLLLSPVQLRMLVTLLPVFCLPYARKVLRGHTREWVVTVLLAWAKMSAVMMPLPKGP
mmetsp:Transcript_41407/g.75007  ORF Transcript_41407/g.75007 Transcript_41407/m.75007 type:complete len:627 (-) Transcript_41407:60-1940(-)